jgi:hypothetical protein
MASKIWPLALSSLKKLNMLCGGKRAKKILPRQRVRLAGLHAPAKAGNEAQNSGLEIP